MSISINVFIYFNANGPIARDQTRQWGKGETEKSASGAWSQANGPIDEYSF